MSYSKWRYETSDFYGIRVRPAASTSQLIVTGGAKLFLPDATGVNKVIAGGSMAILNIIRASSTAIYIEVRDLVKQ